MNEIVSTTLNDKNKQAPYTNPLLQNLQSQELTRENFSLYQKDIKDILLHLAAQLQGVSLQITMMNIQDPEYIEDLMVWVEHQCNILWDYCRFFGSFTWKIPLSYEYLESIAHKFKPYAWMIKSHILWPLKKGDLKEKEWLFHSVKKALNWAKNQALQDINNISYIKSETDIFPQPTLFSPAHIVDNAVAFQLGTIKEKNINIKNKLSPSRTLNSHKEIFRLVINNLLTNAVKFTPPNGKIGIGIRNVKDKKITFFVQNSWVWIPKGVDVFAHGYTTPSLEWKEWTWLGLSQCKIFLEMIGCSISHNDVPSWGTIFYFTMPKK